MNPSVDPLSHALGSIEAKLELILKTQGEDRTAAATYRTEMRGEIRTTREAVQDLRNRVNNNADELAEMRPDVEDYRIRRGQGQFALGFAKTLWLIFAGIGATGIGFIVHAFWPVPK